ncbi:MAG: FAD:protein FMN transferase [Clostridia bacterium]
MRKSTYAYISGIAVMLLFISLLSGCETPDHGDLIISKTNGMYNTTFIAMDTVMSFSVYGSNAKDEIYKAYEDVKAMEDLLSVNLLGSDIYRINNSKGNETQVSSHVTDQITVAKKVSVITGGALDISIYPIVKAWGFSQGEYTVPSKDVLTSLLDLVDYRDIDVSGDTVKITEGMALDLGAVAKGYTGQYIADKLQDAGMTGGLLSLGGNIQLFGKKPDGSLWKIGIQDPADDSSTVGSIAATDCAVITSGAYQRYFIEDGVTYHHILDPKTGYPVNNGLLSVTVIAKDGTYADCLSTALYVLGYEKAVEVWKSNDGFEAVFVKDDGTVAVTEGLLGIFSENTENVYEYSYICR